MTIGSFDFFGYFLGTLQYVSGLYAIFLAVSFLFIYRLPILRRRKIQQTEVVDPKPRSQLSWASASLVVIALLSTLLYVYAIKGYTRMYMSIEAYPLWYFFLSIGLYVLCFDFYFYVTHRLLHTPILFKYIHSIHHRVRAPSALSPYYLHPVETALYFFYAFIATTILPLHPAALFVGGVAIEIGNFLGHLGYELYPKVFGRQLGFFTTSTYHHLHHQTQSHNFAYMFSWWDHVFSTHDQKYSQIFLKTVTRIDHHD